MALRDRLASARARTDSLFALVAPDAIYDRPIAERHRLIFYLGHLEAFDWNLLARYAMDQPSFHSSFDQLFAFGIDPEPGKERSDTRADWPGVDEVRAYNSRARDSIDHLLADIAPDLVEMAIEHRLMHAETFTYLLHQLPCERKIRMPHEEAPDAPSPQQQMMDVPGGGALLGQLPGRFGWDNEFDRHEVGVPPFRISKYKVTNGEYLRFVREGGEPPPFWKNVHGHWLYRGMFENIPLPLDWPVYVTHEQASAYAGWAGSELPSEAQWHRAANSEAAVNANFERWNPIPVTAAPDSAGPFGAEQMTGNGWEWTSTVFAPFDGFRPHHAYPGYSRDFFDGKHYVMKGGSSCTAACFLRSSFRNWFRPNYPYVYAGFRLVEN